MSADQDRVREIARVIDPDAFKCWKTGGFVHPERVRAEAIAKAEKISALLQQDPAA